MYNVLTRYTKRPLRVSTCRVALKPVLHRTYTTSEVEHPNLGFEPDLLKDQPNRHDHPQRPASQFIKRVPPIEVEGRIAVCDGGGGALGHPKIFINLDPSWDGGVPCGYCGLRYVMKEGHHHH